MEEGDDPRRRRLPGAASQVTQEGLDMGYKGKGNYEERDKLFQQSFDGKPVNKNEVKKSLDSLFNTKKKEEDKERCLKGHAWIRDFDRTERCAYCKVLRYPPAAGPGAGSAPHSP
jgi:hypothetical protein